jgi:O-antigen/teichoic acid export membrane protein
MVVVFFELLARYLDVIFNSLLMQGTSQISMLLRACIRVISVLWLYLSGGENVALTTWIIIDATAAVVGCLWGVAMLWRFMKKTALESPGTNQSLDFRRYYRYSLPFYLASTIASISNQNVIRLIATKVLSSNQFASFGFSASLIEMLRRYLPMFLLINMIRPLFVSARQKSDYKIRIPKLAGLVLKLNIFMIVPLVVILGVYSDEIASILTGGKYPEAGSYIIAFLPILITQTIRNVSGLISQAMENSFAPFVATILSMFGLLIGVLMSKFTGVYGLCLGLAVSDVIFTIWVVRAVVVNKLIYKHDYRGFTKLVVLALITFGLLYVISQISADASSVTLIAYCLTILSIYLLFASILKPFTQYERDIINKIIKRDVFVW